MSEKTEKAHVGEFYILYPGRNYRYGVVPNDGPSSVDLVYQEFDENSGSWMNRQNVTSLSVEDLQWLAEKAKIVVDSQRDPGGCS